MSRHHNTTHLEGSALGVAEFNAKRQEDRVLQMYKKDRAYLSPQYVWVKTGLAEENVPLTSVRRAISNLTAPFDPVKNPREPQLVKTKKKVRGRYGKMTHCWIYIGYYKPEETIFHG